MRYRVLITDVDGTLLPRDRRIPPSVREAIRRAKDRGVRVLLATGRMWKSVRPYVEAVEADSPVVLYNGAVVYEFVADRVLERHTLDREGLRTALQVLRRFPGLRGHLFADERVYVDYQDAQSRAYLQRDGIVAEEVGDLVEFVDRLPDDPIKVLVVGDPARLAALDDQLAEQAPGIRRVFSERDFLELLPPGVSKGSALRTVCAALGVRPEEVVALGDNPNDLEMLQAAGLGVAVAGAHPAVLAVADYVTRGGAGEAIVELVDRLFVGGQTGHSRGR